MCLLLASSPAMFTWMMFLHSFKKHFKLPHCAVWFGFVYTEHFNLFGQSDYNLNIRFYVNTATVVFTFCVVA